MVHLSGVQEYTFKLQPTIESIHVVWTLTNPENILTSCVHVHTQSMGYQGAFFILSQLKSSCITEWLDFCHQGTWTRRGAGWCSSVLTNKHGFPHLDCWCWNPGDSKWNEFFYLILLFGAEWWIHSMRSPSFVSGSSKRCWRAQINLRT